MKREFPLFCEIKNASLIYYFDEEEKCYIVEEISSFQSGQGKQLVRVFAEKIGPDKLIKFQAVIEESTIETLIRQGVLRYVENTNKKWETTNPALFRSLRITRVIMGGGLRVEKIIFSPFTAVDKEGAREVGDGPMVLINVYART